MNLYCGLLTSNFNFIWNYSAKNYDTVLNVKIQNIEQIQNLYQHFDLVKYMYLFTQ